MDHMLIFLVLLLLPLNILSFVYRSIRRNDGRKSRYFRPAIISALLIPLSTILAISEVNSSPSNYKISDLKFQINKLESLLEEKSMLLNSRILEIEQSKKLIEEMDKKIEYLQKTLNDVKFSYDGSSVSDEKIKAMDDEVQQLWDESRRNNFNIHVSESKTLEAEKKVKEVASKVEQMQNIINEQWIQIQRLEQSLQMTKVMTSRVNNKVSSDGYKRKKSIGCLMSKLRRSIASHALSKPVGLPDSFFLGGSISRSSLLKAANQIKGMISDARKQHHEVLEHLNVFKRDDIDAAAEALDGMPLKEIYYAVKQYVHSERSGDSEAVYLGKEKIDMKRLYDIISGMQIDYEVPETKKD